MKNSKTSRRVVDSPVVQGVLEPCELVGHARRGLTGY